MASNIDGYQQLMDQVRSHCHCNNTQDMINSLQSYHELAYQSDLENKYGKPMPWIGIYIALASLFCTLAMVADLLHGLLNRKLWFPCKYFTLNAATLSVIAVAMKLPVDLNNPMPGIVDQGSKLGSMAFMCTMMPNLLPSLSTMDGKELLTNIIALDVLIITLVVNICIQIKTGVVSVAISGSMVNASNNIHIYPESYYDKSIAIIYVVMLLMLLITHTCSSLAILKCKQILESKLQAGHEIASKDQKHQQPRRLTIEKLKQHVRNYWIMAETGNPQFVTACSATTSASGVICALSTAIHMNIMLSTVGLLWDYQSDYKWSILVILITQFTGVVLGSIAPIARCFAPLNFKLSTNLIWNHIKVYKVESYWTHKLYDWKQSSIPFPFRNRKCKIAIQKLTILILSFCIGFQKVVVMACKIIGLAPILFGICVLCCWMWLKVMFSESSIVLGKGLGLLEQHKDLSRYVLQLQEDTKLADRALKDISKNLSRFIQNAEKRQPNNLMKLLQESKGFKGVEMLNIRYVPSLLVEEFHNGYGWSLPLVTLMTIAISLPNIQKNIVDSLLSSISEGLVYVTLVEETLNATDDHVSIQKAAKMLWLEVEVYHRWLGNNLENPARQVNTTGQILQWFRDTSKTMVTEMETMDVGDQNDDSICRSISANSMYRITQTILLSYHVDFDQVSQEELFKLVSSMISDILASCLINLPLVISVKCHANSIEESEESVRAAAQLLGEATQIINCLEDHELPSLNQDESAFLTSGMLI